MGISSEVRKWEVRWGLSVYSTNIGEAVQLKYKSNWMRFNTKRARISYLWYEQQLEDRYFKFNVENTIAKCATEGNKE